MLSENPFTVTGSHRIVRPGGEISQAKVLRQNDEVLHDKDGRDVIVMTRCLGLTHPQRPFAVSSHLVMLDSPETVEQVIRAVEHPVAVPPKSEDEPHVTGITYHGVWRNTA